MPVDYIFKNTISFKHFVEVANANGIVEDINEHTTKSCRIFTDGANFAWVYVNADGNIGSITRYGMNKDDFLYMLAERLETELWCEHDDEFWDIIDGRSSEESGLVTIRTEELVENYQPPAEIKVFSR